MSRKDFELIAKLLRMSTPIDNETEKKYHSALAAYFSKELKITNPRFNQERFLRACGY